MIDFSSWQYYLRTKKIYKSFFFFCFSISHCLCYKMLLWVQFFRYVVCGDHGTMRSYVDILFYSFLVLLLMYGNLKRRLTARNIYFLLSFIFTQGFSLSSWQLRREALTLMSKLIEDYELWNWTYILGSSGNYISKQFKSTCKNCA